MQFFDNDILIQNIQKLMNANNITQCMLADILGMSQSNVSKALNKNDKKSFTLNQVVGIAKYFNTSIDVLLGNNNVRLPGRSPRDIASFIVQLIEKGDFVVFDHNVEELVYDMDIDDEGYQYTKSSKKNNLYHAFYLPSFWQVPKDSSISNEEKQDMWAEINSCGNKGRHYSTNKVIHQFLQIYAMYKQKGLEEETYRTVVKDLLNHLSDH